MINLFNNLGGFCGGNGGGGGGAYPILGSGPIGPRFIAMSLISYQSLCGLKYFLDVNSHLERGRQALFWPSTFRFVRSIVRWCIQWSASCSLVSAIAFSLHEKGPFWNDSRRWITTANRDSSLMPFTPSSLIGPSWNLMSHGSSASVIGSIR